MAPNDGANSPGEALAEKRGDGCSPDGYSIGGYDPSGHEKTDGYDGFGSHVRGQDGGPQRAGGGAAKAATRAGKSVTAATSATGTEKSRMGVILSCFQGKSWLGTEEQSFGPIL